MANAQTQIVIDPTTNTVFVVPAAGQTLSNAEIAQLLTGIPGFQSQAMSPATFVNSSTPESSSVLIQPEVKNSENAPCYNAATPTLSNQIPSPTTNLVLAPICPNILTPENSPIPGAIVSSHAPNIGSPISSKRKFCSTSASPFTSQLSNISNTTVFSSPVATSVSQKKDTSASVQQQCTVQDVKPFSTLVFFDLETTGLGHQIGPSNVQITEISMVAVDRKDFWECSNSELKDIRVMHKLSMCVRPRSAVSPGAAKVTGLDNFNLIDQTPFDKNAATTIISFLSHLPKPVCLLAHNGNLFDFPLLKAELKRLSMELPPDMLIADTLVAFRTVGIAEMPSDRKICKSVKYGRNGRLSHSLENLHLFFFNKKPAGAHSSEGDCLALAKVCHKVKESALPWLEANAKSLESIKPMW